MEIRPADHDILHALRMLPMEEHTIERAVRAVAVMAHQTDGRDEVTPPSLSSIFSIATEEQTTHAEFAAIIEPYREFFGTPSGRDAYHLILEAYRAYAEICTTLHRTRTAVEGALHVDACRLRASYRRSLQQALRLREIDDLRTKAYIDSLTKLGNRYALAHFFEHEAQRTLEFANLDHRHFGVIKIDLDNFKHLNDARGHAVGDEALRRVATILRETVVGSHDIWIRDGGDECLAITCGTTTMATRSIATEICRRTRDELIFDGIQLTASVGVLTTDDPLFEGAPVEKLIPHYKTVINLTDVYANLAKLRGKDQVVGTAEMPFDRLCSPDRFDTSRSERGIIRRAQHFLPPSVACTEPTPRGIIESLQAVGPRITHAIGRGVQQSDTLSRVAFRIAKLHYRGGDWWKDVSGRRS